MPYYAMVVVVEANDEQEAHTAITGSLPLMPFIAHVGAPRGVEPVRNSGHQDAPDTDLDFDTDDLVSQWNEEQR